ncbi:tRNA-intron lyase [Methanothermobacter wolfeii]|uniref:tRNA-splicing endonuclease n=1 Tax=Methanothermobacter wolfeii TaxID=145261 RepID=A0A9E7UMD3_METWO|nr:MULTISPECIES: tRNA-intron lyase [Methanothermobacter]MDI6702833.1 tRNA-intron lyase [Methanothermobacter wolfeii]MDI6842213.1 tRNA-intron lyase [Methanothermobacter wolfeii]NLM02275.1 tRNA-intron lyase [Methanothermobacter wolfeii]QHN06160.1 tRNA-intron lyase [Methanothermobacter sp. THM-1]UXH32360.1 tRNA-intron lyase [Methanothermobacter wolfeii]
MQGQLGDEVVTVKLNSMARRLHEKSHYGKIYEERLQISLIEAAYLMEKGKLKLKKDDDDVTLEEFISLLAERGLYSKYLVYRDLRNRGYIVKTGFKYGVEFRLYERGGAPGRTHSAYLVRVISENATIHALDFSSYVRVAHGVNKRLLLAFLDDEEDITYYLVDWIRP